MSRRQPDFQFLLCIPFLNSIGLETCDTGFPGRPVPFPSKEHTGKQGGTQGLTWGNKSRPAPCEWSASKKPTGFTLKVEMGSIRPQGVIRGVPIEIKRSELDWLLSSVPLCNTGISTSCATVLCGCPRCEIDGRGHFGSRHICSTSCAFFSHPLHP